jgi:hypothetical protein
VHNPPPINPLSPPFLPEPPPCSHSGYTEKHRTGGGSFFKFCRYLFQNNGASDTETTDNRTADLNSESMVILSTDPVLLAAQICSLASLLEQVQQGMVALSNNVSDVESEN